MIKIIIHIENEVEIWDESVCVECELPQVPEIGSILHLSDDLETELERKATFSKTKENYFPNWFYGNLPDDFEDLPATSLISFSDAVNVKYVKYEPNNKKVRITLGA